MATYLFSGGPPSGFVDTALRFREILAQQKGFIEVAVGVTHEEVPFDGDKGHAMVALVGWKTEQDWQTWADSQEAKEKNPSRGLGEGVLRKFEVEVVGLEPV